MELALICMTGANRLLISTTSSPTLSPMPLVPPSGALLNQIFAPGETGNGGLSLSASVLVNGCSSDDCYFFTPIGFLDSPTSVSASVLNIYSNGFPPDFLVIATAFESLEPLSLA
jgi:hypothetical protein